MKKIGFIGVGIMGSSMARNLMKAGYTLYVYNRSPEKARAVAAQGAVFCSSIRECVAPADAVISMVGFPKDVEEVYFGEGGVLDSAHAEQILIDMTTTSPTLSQRIYAAAKAKGLSALDAPVSGGDLGARDGTLSIMVGGDEDVFAACYDLFAAMGTTILYEGGAGSGQHTKMANQIAIAGALAGVAEAVTYAEEQGLEPGKLFASISKGAAASFQLEHMGPKMASGDYAPGFFLKHFVKDLTLAKEEAAAKGSELRVLDEVLGILRRLEGDGMGELGTPAIIEYYKK